ncbi:MAG: TlpA family protein disulfide reductase [Actinomycetia bacterium]|nr:TlpA family protein disulfide reductase [Actinomycetes bacterium]
MRLLKSPVPIQRVLPLAAVGLAIGLALAGCGADAETAAPVSSPPSEASDAGGDAEKDKEPGPEVDISNSVLPSVQVKDVAGGEIDLAGLVPSETPILLWAWAPSCTICAGEAPGVEAFAKQNANAVTVVGLGTQDDLALAEDFVSTYGVSTPQMLWDPGFESWRALEITGQPAWVLLSPGGEELGRWQGGLPESEILANL